MHISLPISLKLWLPVLKVGSGRVRSSAPMRMPEAPVNKDEFHSRREYQIWFSQEVHTMQSEAKPQCVSQAANNQFRFRILAANRAHIVATAH
jgi:hypothetical protein